MPELQMDEQQLLQALRDLSLEEGKTYLQEHMEELKDAAISALLENEALNQLYTNYSTSLKFADLLIFFSECAQHKPAHALGLKAKGDVLRAIGLHKAAIDCLDAAGEEFLLLRDEDVYWPHRVLGSIAELRKEHLPADELIGLAPGRRLLVPAAVLGVPVRLGFEVARHFDVGGVMGLQYVFDGHRQSVALEH